MQEQGQSQDVCQGVYGERPAGQALAVALALALALTSMFRDRGPRLKSTLMGLV